MKIITSPSSAVGCIMLVMKSSTFSGYSAYFWVPRSINQQKHTGKPIVSKLSKQNYVLFSNILVRICLFIPGLIAVAPFNSVKGSRTIVVCIFIRNGISLCFGGYGQCFLYQKLGSKLINFRHICNKMFNLNEYLT